VKHAEDWTEDSSTSAPPRTQTQLAWDLAIALAPRLKRPDRNRLFAMIGAGETLSAIEELLTRAARRQEPLTESLTNDIALWLNGYEGTPREPRLRVVLDCLLRAETPTHGGGSDDRANA
jgi:hypothetical protein